VNYVERRQRAREGGSKAAAEGPKRQENTKKILNRGNELKDLLQTQGLTVFGAKNELKTNWFLSAKSAN
jgi:hypothetical protein